MVEEGKHYFLSRPRRFGKSLFLDTLNELFEGNEPLFEGLAIHEHWDWSVRHPVVRLDFGSGRFRNPDGLRDDVAAQLDAIERGAEVDARYDAAHARFRYLLQMLHERTGQRVAVLVDEYDKPILDALDTPEVARTNRDHPARAVFDHQVRRRARRVHAAHRCEQVLEGKPVHPASTT